MLCKGGALWLRMLSSAPVVIQRACLSFQHVLRASTVHISHRSLFNSDVSYVMLM